MREIFTRCTSIEEADEIGRFIGSKGYEGVQNDSYRYCKLRMDVALKENKRHNREYLFVGANQYQKVVAKIKRALTRLGLKYVEKPRMFKELLSEPKYIGDMKIEQSEWIKSMIHIELVYGVEGKAVYLNNRRVWGNKPWGGALGEIFSCDIELSEIAMSIEKEHIKPLLAEIGKRFPEELHDFCKH